MTVRQSRNTVLIFAAPLIAGMTFGAPAMAASTLHAHIPNHVILQAPIANLQPGLQIHETNRAIAPHFPVVQPRSDDPFGSLHQE
jgi:hypothetical protein